MDMTGPGDGDRFPHAVTIMLFNGRYFLIRGEEYINEVLRGEGGFPTPVACVTVTDFQTANAAVEDGKSMTDLWMINAHIVARLRNDGVLVETTLDED